MWLGDVGTTSFRKRRKHKKKKKKVGAMIKVSFKTTTTCSLFSFVKLIIEDYVTHNQWSYLYK